MDSNSNARFDDEIRIRTYSGGRLYPSVGDTIFVDPDPSKGKANNFQQPVGKLLNIAGSFYDMKLSPAGDQLPLTPSGVPVGYVSNSNKGVGALVQSSNFTRTYISARAKNDCTAVDVREGETVDLPFGPPYKPIVKASRTAASGSSSNRTAYLSLSLVGAGGELVSDLRVNGSRPEVPQFTITGAEEKVAQGKFRYG